MTKVKGAAWAGGIAVAMAAGLGGLAAPAHADDATVRGDYVILVYQDTSVDGGRSQIA